LSFPFPTETVREGSVSITVPELRLYTRTGQYVPSLAPVFYNPRMKLNRDVAVLVLRAFQRGASHPTRVAEPLAGSGIRGIRYCKEVPEIEGAFLNDLNPSAAYMIERNVEDNALTGKITVSNLEANSFLAHHATPKQRFDFVDIDPYGSPSPYLDTAIRSLTNRGLLAVTATDTAPLCGVGETACVRKYWGRPLRTEYSRELAVRLILNSIVLTASRYDRGIKVLLTHATDHYFRAYVQIIRGAQRSDASISQLGYVLHCFHCMNRTVSQGLVQVIDAKCPLCGNMMRIAGPVWLGPLVDGGFCKTIIDTSEAKEKRAFKLLGALIEEADSSPCYFVSDKICDKFNLPIPPRNSILSGLRKLGHRATGTHFHSAGVRTDASIQELKEVISSLARN